MNEFQKQSAELVARVKKGADAQAEEKLFRLSSDVLLGWFGGRLREAQASLSAPPRSEDADDLVMRVMDKVFRAIRGGKYEDRGSYKSFIFEVAGNVLLDHLRKLSGKAYHHLDHPHDDEDGPALQIPSEEEVVGSLIEREFLNLILEEVPREPNADAAAVFVGRCVLGLSVDDVAQALDAPGGTIKSHFHRMTKGLLERVRMREDYREISFESLRGLIERRLALTDKDLEGIEPSAVRDALRAAAQPGSTLTSVARALRVSEDAAAAAVRAGMNALSKKRLRRVPVAPARGDAVEHLWSAVDRVLAAYPQLAAATRAEGDGEEEALCALFIHLAGAALGRDARPTLGAMVGERIGTRPVKDVAKELNISFTQLAAILSNSLPAHKLDAALAGTLARYCDCGEDEVRAASARMRLPDAGKTRGGDRIDRLWERYCRSFRRAA